MQLRNYEPESQNRLSITSCTIVIVYQGLHNYTDVYSRESIGLENISQILTRVFASASSKMAYGLEEIPLLMRNSRIVHVLWKAGFLVWPALAVNKDLAEINFPFLKPVNRG